MSIGSLTRARNRRLARLDELLKERILILDGAMGTMIQAYVLEEQNYRGTRFPELAADPPMIISPRGPVRVRVLRITPVISRAITICLP
jgi:hypothetical protein